MLLAVPLNPMPSHTVQLLTHTDNAHTPAATARKPVYPYTARSRHKFVIVQSSVHPIY